MSIAVRWGESLMRERPDFRENVLYQLDQEKITSPSFIIFSLAALSL
jgi:hypothetical protein